MNLSFWIPAVFFLGLAAMWLGVLLLGVVDHLLARQDSLPGMKKF
jgi:hypothetical protein